MVGKSQRGVVVLLHIICYTVCIDALFYQNMPTRIPLEWFVLSWAIPWQSETLLVRILPR